MQEAFLLLLLFINLFIFIEVSWPDEYEEDSLEDKG
jgi:hypothetical protein